MNEIKEKHIAVSPQVDLFLQQDNTYEVNWCSIGTVGIYELEEFIKALNEALEIMKK